MSIPLYYAYSILERRKRGREREILSFSKDSVPWKCIAIAKCEWNVGRFVAFLYFWRNQKFSVLNFFITRLFKKIGIIFLNALMFTSLYSKITAEVKTLRKKLMSYRKKDDYLRCWNIRNFFKKTMKLSNDHLTWKA